MLKGHVGVVDTPFAVTVADTEHLVIQAKELQKEEERLKTAFPTATKVMDPDDCQSSASDGNTSHSQENGDESESSGILVTSEDFTGSQESLGLIEGSGGHLPKTDAATDKAVVGPSDGSPKTVPFESQGSGKTE